MSVMDRFRFDGKRALVTGASRGLGRVMALALADAGADIVITGRTAETLETTAGEIRSRGRKAGTVQADMGVPAECEAACERVLAEMGPIDILVNNVGSREMSVPIATEPLDVWQRSVDLNLTSCFLGTKIMGQAMIERGQGGRIINIASISGLVANRGIGGRDYETTKAAVLHFTRCAAVDWAPHGITVERDLPGSLHDRQEPRVERAAAGRDRCLRGERADGTRRRARRDRAACRVPGEPRLGLRHRRRIRDRRGIHGLVSTIARLSALEPVDECCSGRRGDVIAIRTTWSARRAIRCLCRPLPRRRIHRV